MNRILYNSYPRRMPLEKLKACYKSVEEAFMTGDYLYAARYGKDNPEIFGCSLIMMGNRRAGEAILDKANIDSAHSFLIRAFSAWQRDYSQLALHYIIEGRKTGDLLDQFDRLESLMSQHQFQILIHSEQMKSDSIKLYKNIPDCTVIRTRFTQGDADYILQMGRSIKSHLPPELKFDLVIVQDFKFVPQGLTDLGAPIVNNCNDEEWYYDQLPLLMKEVDLISANSTSQFIELGRTFSVPCSFDCHSLPIQIPDTSKLEDYFLNPGHRPLDLVFTGGMADDYYRDKKQRILDMAINLGNRYAIKMHQGYLPEEDYWTSLRSSKFSFMSTRITNHWSSRCLEFLSQGVIPLIEEENGFNHLFSKEFPCFQYYKTETLIADFDNSFRRYDQIREATLPFLSQIKSEITDMFLNQQEQARNYIRRLLFETKVRQSPKKLQERRPEKPSRRVLTSFQNLLINEQGHLATLSEVSRSYLSEGRPSDWLRVAQSRFFLNYTLLLTHPNNSYQLLLPSAIEALKEGLYYHPRSLILNYALSQCCIFLNDFQTAFDLLMQVISQDLELHQDDFFPRYFDQRHGCFWIADARVRESVAELASLKPEINVWRSFAFSHLADLTLKIAHSNLKGGDDDLEGKVKALESLMEGVQYVDQALFLFPHNDIVQRTHLRIAYCLRNLGIGIYEDIFMDSFEQACRNDPLIMNDLGALAYDLYASRGLDKKCLEIKTKMYNLLNCYLARPDFFELYPEVQSLIVKHDLPHGSLRKNDEIQLMKHIHALPVKHQNVV